MFAWLFDINRNQRIVKDIQRPFDYARNTFFSNIQSRMLRMIEENFHVGHFYHIASDKNTTITYVLYRGLQTIACNLRKNIHFRGFLWENVQIYYISICGITLLQCNGHVYAIE